MLKRVYIKPEYRGTADGQKVCISKLKTRFQPKNRQLCTSKLKTEVQPTLCTITVPQTISSVRHNNDIMNKGLSQTLSEASSNDPHRI
jgi:hypothetical protein